MKSPVERKLSETRRREIYKIVDSFLVEAKDQHGNERSLERLNIDRHLAVNNIMNIISQACQDERNMKSPVERKSSKTRRREVKEIINNQNKINNHIERLISGNNVHSIYHLCIKHGFGCNMPYDNNCPDCDNETYLYISGDDVVNIISQARQDERKRCVEILINNDIPGHHVVNGIINNAIAEIEKEEL